MLVTKGILYVKIVIVELKPARGFDDDLFVTLWRHYLCRAEGALVLEAKVGLTQSSYSIYEIFPVSSSVSLSVWIFILFS